MDFYPIYCIYIIKNGVCLCMLVCWNTKYVFIYLFINSWQIVNKSCQLTTPVRLLTTPVRLLTTPVRMLTTPVRMLQTLIRLLTTNFIYIDTNSCQIANNSCQIAANIANNSCQIVNNSCQIANNSLVRLLTTPLGGRREFFLIPPPLPLPSLSWDPPPTSPHSLPTEPTEPSGTWDRVVQAQASLIVPDFIISVYGNHRKRIKTEEKADAWGERIYSVPCRASCFALDDLN